ncbi:alpha-L-fucosidase [Leadbettera azotonutricia]|uniref:Alpha-L-fucosidase n=1 Tax=Leadbettera azotonutricia (strain ATCC BAA-888 / DSM 13862 / ZAS-9) TaxID=545695 RepID=F5Y896_LEAAZ|nr:alpha-L-fucosidase [Leadbettera azotonutricia]AEF82471.1 hypothetical protein TREAZ_0986 [Leadbettera azotonutricia ZAS-9]
MEPWYKTKFRRTLMDMHIEDWDKTFLSEFDPEVYFKALKEAKISAAMIYVQSHVGLCYWPTESGVMHKGFIGKEDAMKRLFNLCHDDGINTILYYSIIYNNRAYELHPKWRMIDGKGRGSRDYGGRYGLNCPNNKDYLEFVKKQIAEFSDYFDYDGIFFDMTFWPEVCYCDSCKERWEKEAPTYGAKGELPKTVNWKDHNWKTFIKLRHEWIGEFAKTITNEAKRLKPGVSVEHQYGSSMNFWRFANNENVTLASDYVGTDLYGGIKEQSFACKAWYNLTQNQPFQYMTSRCYPSLSEHTTTKTYDQLRQCVAMTCLHHGAPLLIDAIDPVGTIDDTVYKTIGKVFGEVIPMEPYLTHGKLTWDVSLYFDLNGKMDIEAKEYDVLDPALNGGTPEGGTMPHYIALRGASDSLARHHIPYGIINNWKIEQLKEHKTLVLSDVPEMLPEQASFILDYLRDGGNVYISGHISPVLLKELFNAEWDRYTYENITYMSPANNSNIMQGLFTQKHPLIMFEHAPILKKGNIKGEILATLVLPYTPPGVPASVFPTDVLAKYYIDKKSPNYPFATIHANPPGIYTDQPAIIKALYGKGKVIWSALPIEKADRFQHSEIFAGIIRYLSGDDFQFGADCPISIECILFDDPENKQKLFGLIETREDTIIPPTYDLRVWIKSTEPPKKVHTVDGSDLPFDYRENKITIDIPKINIYDMIIIKY